MKFFSVYDPATGEIRGTGKCQDDDLVLQGSGSLLVLEGTGAAGTHHVVAGDLVAYTETQAADKAARQYRAVWSNATMTWLDQRSLGETKADCWLVIKSHRNAAEFGGFTWDGSTFDSDPESQSRIQGAAQLATLAMLASQSFSVDWTLADNTVRTLSGANMLAVGQQMGVHIMTMHATGRVLREAIAAATTTETLELILWPAA